jgi:sulfoxide reductase heme-binding subunit YedZ
VTRRKTLQAAVWIGGLAPAAWIVWRALHGSLGANPVETLEHATGDWALRLLLAALAVSPLRRLTGWHALIAQRRSLGLLAFGYAACHFTVWAVFDLGLDPGAIVEDVHKRPYVTVGFTAFVLLVPLAVTSTRGWIRRLGRRWTSLHRLVYVAAGLAVLHYAWLVKADLRPPLAYGAGLAALLLLRIPLRRRGVRGVRRARPPRAEPVGTPGRAAEANRSA